MKVFITGVSGFLGRSLAKKLNQSGAIVLGLSRNSGKAQKKLHKNISVVESLHDASDFLPDIVINLQGEPIASGRWSATKKQKILDSRVGFTEQLVEWMRDLAQTPELFISGSAIGFYGRSDEQPLDESSPFVDEFTHQLCAEWEAKAMQAEAFTRVCIIRTGLVLSKYEGMLGQMRLPFLLGLGGKLGGGEQFQSWVHLNDWLEAVDWMIKNQKAQGIYNLTAPNPVTQKHFAQSYAKSLNRPCFMSTPSWVLKALLGEMSDLLLTGQNVLPKKLQQEGFVFQFEKVEDAFEALK